mmetsp:Transcript_104814/g.177093  ORF Transcript_104814/g.177093 Transcript_104814/m.177093 type:complete len:92 (-) Transcript_104814:94-369(-)
MPTAVTQKDCAHRPTCFTLLVLLCSHRLLSSTERMLHFLGWAVDDAEGGSAAQLQQEGSVSGGWHIVPHTLAALVCPRTAGSRNEAVFTFL